MPVTQPISGAKVGASTTAVGTPEVQNQWQGILCAGFASSVVPTKHLVRDPNGVALVNFTFADPRPAPSYNLVFGEGARLLYQHTYAVDDVAGTPSVTNAAQDIRPTGHYDVPPITAPVVTWTLRRELFNFNLVALPFTPPNLYWGTTQLIYGHGVPNSNKFGDLISEQPLPIWGAGFRSTPDALRFGGVLATHVIKRNEFNLDLVAPQGEKWNFVFTGNQITKPRGYDHQNFGATSVANAAQDIRPTGFVQDAVPQVVVHIGKVGWIEFSLDQTWARPNAANIGFYFAGGKQIDAGSWDSSEFGTPNPYLSLQPVHPTGIASTAVFGTLFTENYGLKIIPEGIASTAVFGTPKLPGVLKPHAWDSNIFQNFTWVQNHYQYLNIYPFTGQPITPPSPKVYNLLQFVRPGGMPAPTAFGTAHLTLWAQVVNHTGWQDPDWYGNPWVTHHTRSIGPAYLSGTQTSFGTPFAALGARDLRPDGQELTRYGEALVRDRAQNVLPVGLAPTHALGIPQVRDRSQYFYPFGVDVALIGFPVVNLWQQYVAPVAIQQWAFEGDRFGYYRTVYNKNRYMQANGFVHSVLPLGGFVLNKARPIRPYGEVQTRFGTAFAAARIRYITPEWYEGTPFGYDTYVRTRKIINLDGWGFRGPNVPLPIRVWSNLQTVQPFSTYAMTEMPRPWVSPGLRSLSPHSILTQPAGDPFVAYAIRYITPLGIEKGYVGVHQLETHQNIIRVWGYPNGEVGEPRAYNVTPEIRAFSAYAFEPGGKPRVELWKRYLHVEAAPNPPTVPAPFISDRMRRIRAPSLDYLRWGNGQVMFDQSQQTPPQKLILPDSVQAGAGVVPNEEWEHPDAPWTGANIPFGYPLVKLNTIFVDSLGQVDRFGEPSTRSMVIVCDPGPSSTAMGRPTLEGGTQWIERLQGIDASAVFGATNVVGPQRIRLDAKWDAASSTWYPWSFHTNTDPQDRWFDWRAQTAGPTFGAYTTVTNKHRPINPWSYSYFNDGVTAVFGRPTITTRPQHIRPPGYTTYKRGMPDVSFVGDKPIYTMDWVDAVFGAPSVTVEDWGPKWIRPAGTNDTRFGTSSRNDMRVEHFHRQIPMTGWVEFQSWKGAQYVGPYLRIYPKSYIQDQYGNVLLDTMTTFGTLYIDYKHRKIYPLDVTDDLPDWSATLKHAPRGYFIEGTPSAVQFGDADVGARVKYANLGGWEEFDTGFSYVPDSYPGLSNLHAQSFIATAHNEMMEFGNGTISHN